MASPFFRDFDFSHLLCQIPLSLSEWSFLWSAPKYIFTLKYLSFWQNFHHIYYIISGHWILLEVDLKSNWL